MPHPKKASVPAHRQQQANSTKFSKVLTQLSDKNEPYYQPQYDSSVSTERDDGSGDSDLEGEE